MSRKSKTVTVFCILLVICLTIITPATAAQPIRVILDGITLLFDVQPNTVDGRTMVPMRVIFEALGAEVQWNAATSTITATKDDLVIQTTIGNKTMRINGVAKEMDTAPISIAGRTLVPVRFISEAFNCEVRWDPDTRTVHISSPNPTYPANPATHTERVEHWGGWVEELVYDAHGNLVMLSWYAPAGHLDERRVYNERGYVIEISIYDYTGDLWWRTEYEYDVHGNEIEVRNYGSNGELERRTVLEYDNRNNLKTEVTYFHNEGPITWYSSYYDSNGNRIQTFAYGNNELIWWSMADYNIRGWLITETCYRADNSIIFIQSHEYNTRGDVIKIISKVPELFLEVRVEIFYDEDGYSIDERVVIITNGIEVEIDDVEEWEQIDEVEDWLDKQLPGYWWI